MFDTVALEGDSKKELFETFHNRDAHGTPTAICFSNNMLIFSGVATELKNLTKLKFQGFVSCRRTIT